MSLTGKTVLITGGGTGVGADLARGFAGAGASVIVAGRRLDPLEQVAGETGGRAVQVDVTDEGSVAAMFLAAGPVDIVIANAGASASAPFGRIGARGLEIHAGREPDGDVPDAARRAAPDERLGAVDRRRLDRRVEGVCLCCPLCGGQAWGRGADRSLALEVARKPITANALCPGFLDTEMTDRSVANIVEKTGLSSEDARSRLASTNPQKRLIQPAEVTAAALWLCGPGSEGMNGQSIPIAGGEV